ncbi:PREDICTED: ankyrin repeat domain-containing protein 12 isoform X2 [Vollenhovia emeryi]|uniref:ankyrin repeat domain-containing protein 12 isoform X2 n=1 Tax=Vollenhovia emeryi TaxID=411798 RepID=UPI0005F3F49F|nr:PREDICTED: ankyrin repeat domain-containing protein 12 isoform X2 [Vollenhovia emeryi]
MSAHLHVNIYVFCAASYMNYEDGMPAGGNSRIREYYSAPMSERQQLALLLQMTSQEMVSGGNRPENTSVTNTSSRASSLQQQRGAKGRWSNKNGESPVQTTISRKEDFRVRQMIVNGYDIGASREINDIADAAASPKESATAAPKSLCSPAETAAAATAAPSNEQQEQTQHQSYQHQTQYQQQQQPAVESTPTAASHVAEDSGALCEMRRTPPQNKVDRSGTGQSGSSPRVTLRLNQVRGARDEKKGGGTSNSRQGNVNVQGQNSMEASSKVPINVSSTNSNTASGTGNASSSADSGDVYEFKSSKEPTPVRGTSSSPNPNPDKDKDSGKPSNGQGSQSGGGNVSTIGSSSTSITEATMAPLTSSEDTSAVSTSSPSAKRVFEGETTDEQDEENRRKKRKDSEVTKESTKNNPTGRQSTGRNTVNSGEKCIKSGKQGSGMISGKGSQNTSCNADRKSPNASSMASSPKPSNTSSSTSAKTSTPALPESDGEEDRSKCADSNSAPKVPPLKIVIPQSTASEQEQGNRNGKNVTNRSHQLPYVVASSNSNDSTEKDQSQSTSDTISPMEGSISTKGEDKKDFSGTLHGEERSTHHQRVLRSSHRTGNGNNGSTSKDVVPSSGNGSYSTSSPLPANTTIDRSNNSSPQQRHHSPTPETVGSDISKTTSSESATTGTISKCNTAMEKSDKNTDAAGKNQKDSSMENLENISATTSSVMSNAGTSAPPVDLHPRKRKMKPSKEAQQAAATAAANEAAEATSTGPEIHPHDQPITNCYQLFLNIRKQIERRRKGLFPVQPKPPQGFKDYLMNRCTYVLAGNAKEPNVNPPVSLHGAMKDLYVEQEKERYRLRMQHVVEKEKLVLSVEQEILRVHGRAARALANQSLPFSVCTILKDEEVYNVITPEQEEKDRNARSRYNGRLFLSWLQDVDDKWEKIKEGMLLRHHNEAESLHAVQRMHWEWKLKEVGLCESKTTPQIEDVHVPMVHVSDDFDLLPA